MNLLQIDSLLQRVRYKPGSRFGVQETFNSSRVVVSIEQPVINAKPPYDKTSVKKTFYIEREDLAEMDEKGFLDKLYKEILNQEEHELREFFLVDGRNYVDPHPERASMGEREEALWKKLDRDLRSMHKPKWYPMPEALKVFDAPRDRGYRFEAVFGAKMTDHRSVFRWTDSDSLSLPDAKELENDEG